MVVYLQHFYANMLVQFDHIVRILYKLIGQLRDVDKAILMNTDVDKGAKGRDVGDYTRQLHSFDKVIDGFYPFCKMKLLQLHARVATGFLEFLHDVRQGGQSHLARDILLYIDLCPEVFLFNKVLNRAMLVLGHLLNNSITLWMHRAIVERILGIGDTQKTGTLLVG